MYFNCLLFFKWDRAARTYLREEKCIHFLVYFSLLLVFITFEGPYIEEDFYSFTFCPACPFIHVLSPVTITYGHSIFTKLFLHQSTSLLFWGSRGIRRYTNPVNITPVSWLRGHYCNFALNGQFLLVPIMLMKKELKIKFEG